jgi:hypothetical protein
VNIKTKYNIGDIVYLKTDVEQLERMITGITIRENGLVIGYIDTKIGIREEEQKNYTEQNPVITDIHKIVKELKEKSRN